MESSRKKSVQSLEKQPLIPPVSSGFQRDAASKAFRYNATDAHLLRELGALPPTSEHPLFHLREGARYRIGMSRAEVDEGSCLQMCGMGACALTGIGLCYIFSVRHIVPDGYIGFTLTNGIPEILAPGAHYLLNIFQSFEGILDLNGRVVRAGPIKIITVPEGHVCTTQRDGEFVILGPGRHVIESATHDFYFKHSEDMNFVSLRGDVSEDGTSVVKIGMKTLLMLSNNRVAITQNNGEMEVVRPGAYKVLQHANHIFVKTIPTNQLEIKLHAHEITSKDSVKLRVIAILIVRISDPILAISNFDASTAVLRERAEAVLCNVFATVNYRDRAVIEFNPKGKSEVSPAVGDPDSAPFFEMVQHNFRHNFHAVMSESGIEVIQFGLVEVLPVDADYLGTMSAAAKMHIENEKNLRRAKGEQDIQRQELMNKMEKAQREQEIVSIETQTEVSKIQAIGEAKAKALERMVQAAGGSPFALIQAQSDAISNLGNAKTLIFGEAPFAASGDALHASKHEKKNTPHTILINTSENQER